MSAEPTVQELRETVAEFVPGRGHVLPEIAWCCGPACRLKGGDRIREAMQQVLELPLGGHSDDHRYGLHIGQCNGTCSEAPQVWVNGKVVGNLTVSNAIQLARKVRGAE
jgi:NADH:ubiquinone oxidoreductase subunit E